MADAPDARPDFIAHWTEFEEPDGACFDGSDEQISIGAPIGQRLGLTRIGIHHERLLPGRRTSLPHAESAEEEFVYVLEGTPDVWLDGVVHRLQPGDAVAFPAGTGIAHSFHNDTDEEVRLLVVGEADKAENRIVYPLHPERTVRRTDWWDDAPKRELGPHDGMSARRRAEISRRKDPK